MMTTIIACAISLLFIIFSERSVRNPGEARRYRVNGKWQIHTFLYLSLVVLGLILSPLLNLSNIGLLHGHRLVGWIGITVLVTGFFIRLVAMKTLGKYHTRSLVVVSGQSVVSEGIYKYVRHPGYLGTIIGAIGFALATTNWIIILYAGISVALIFGLRIRAEEDMMVKAFGSEYVEYMNKTKRLVPFIY